jgi:hypothetical protein
VQQNGGALLFVPKELLTTDLIIEGLISAPDFRDHPELLEQIKFGSRKDVNGLLTKRAAVISDVDRALNEHPLFTGDLVNNVNDFLGIDNTNEFGENINRLKK